MLKGPQIFLIIYHKQLKQARVAHLLAPWLADPETKAQTLPGAISMNKFPQALYNLKIHY